MVSIDINVGNTLHTVLAAQGLDGNATIVENTKTGGTVTPCVVQTRNRYKRLPAFPRKDPLDRIQHTANNVASGFINALESRGITAIQVTFPDCRLPDDTLHIVSAMKTLKHRTPDRHRLTLPHTLIESGCTHLLPEGSQPVRTERMARTETVTGKIFTNIDTEI
jgi:hypothetical protein